MVESVDTPDLKSVVRMDVGVQVPPLAPKYSLIDKLWLLWKLFAARQFAIQCNGFDGGRVQLLVAFVGHHPKVNPRYLPMKVANSCSLYPCYEHSFL